MESSEPQEDFTKIPLEDRIQHKNWKARVNGYEELTKKLATFEDKEYSKFSPYMKKFVVDANAAAQEKGLSAVLVFIDYAPNAGKFVDSVVFGIVTKCLTSSKAKTKELSLEIILKCIEIDKQDVTLEELIKGLEQKVPKNVAAVIRTIRECLNQFGAKVIGIKPLIPHLCRLLEDRDATVRDETKKLTIEIYRWVKDALLPQLSNLKPLLLDPLKEEFEKVKAERAIPTKLLRSQQEVVQEDSPDGENPTSCEGDAEPGTGNEAEEMDPFELMDPVDIIAKLPGDFFTLLESKKWSERKDELEKLQKLCEDNPKLMATSDYAELVKVLKKLVSKDSNVVVVALAIKCVALLATGLRKGGFEKFANGCLTVMFDKFKEKKANVVTALKDSCDAIYLCTTLESFHEDVVAALDNKNPSIRSEVALFLARCFAKTNPALINKKLLKTLVTSLLKTLSDSDAVVRESAAEALGICYKQQGERNMAPHLQDLEALKMTKIKEYMDKAVVTKFAVPPPAVGAGSSANGKPKGPPVRKPGVGVKKPSLPDDDSYDLGPPVELGPAKLKTTVFKPVVRAGTIAKGPAKRPATTGGRVGAGGTRSTGGPPTSAPASVNPSGAANASLMPLNMTQKEQRVADEKTLKVLKWNFSAPREEFYITLKEQLQTAEWNPSLVALMFNTDFKFHIKAIEQMTVFFNNPKHHSAVAANVDLVLKWFALRFFDTNPAMVLKGLDLVIMMFRILNQEGKQLHEFEASSFLPYLILKLGEQKEQIKKKAQEILELARGIFSVQKICVHLHAGLQSKNTRQRANCLDEIAALIQLKGITIFGPPNSNQILRDIAKLVGDRDNTIRNSVLKCILQVYHYEGEKVYKLINATALNEKDLNFIEERIKRAPRPKCEMETEVPPAQMQQTSIQPPTSGISKLPSFGLPRPASNSATLLRRPVESHAPVTLPPPISSMDEYEPEAEELALPPPLPLPKPTISELPRRPRFMPRSDTSSVVTNSSSLLTNSSSNSSNSNSHLISDAFSTQSDDLSNVISKASPFANRVQQALLQPSALRLLGSPMGVNHDITEKLMHIFDGLSSTDSKAVCFALTDLKEFFSDYPKYEMYLSGKADQLAVLFNKQLRLFYKKYQEGTSTPDDESVFRHTVQRVRQAFKLQLSKRISRDCLLEMITHLMPFFIAMKSDKMISHVVCSVPVEMLAGADPTNLICALYRKMGQYVQDLVNLKGKPDEQANRDRVNNCLDFTMKFVWRTLKQLDDNMVARLNVDMILFETHSFLCDYPRSFFRKNEIDELPMKTVKTLLYSLTQRMGESILNHLTLIHNKDDSEMFLYVQRGLRQIDSASVHSTSASSTVSLQNGQDTPMKERNGSTTATIISNGTNPLESHLSHTPTRHMMNCPDGKSKDLQNYCDYISRQVDVNLDYQTIVRNARSISSVEEAEDFVQEAARKKDEFKKNLGIHS